MKFKCFYLFGKNSEGETYANRFIFYGIDSFIHENL